MTTFSLDHRKRAEIGAVLLFIVIVRLSQYHRRSYSLCSFVVHQFITQFPFFIKEELWQLSQKGATLVYGVCSLSSVPAPLAQPSNGMISSCTAFLPQPSSRKSSSQRLIRSPVPSRRSRPTL